MRGLNGKWMWPGDSFVDMDELETWKYAECTTYKTISLRKKIGGFKSIQSPYPSHKRALAREEGFGQWLKLYTNDCQHKLQV